MHTTYAGALLGSKTAGLSAGGPTWKQLTAARAQRKREALRNRAIAAALAEVIACQEARMAALDAKYAALVTELAKVEASNAAERARREASPWRRILKFFCV